LKVDNSGASKIILRQERSHKVVTEGFYLIKDFKILAKIFFGC